MAEQSAGEKTEAPSAKRLKDARQRGQVPRSQDVLAALALLTVTSVLAWSGGAGIVRIEQRLVQALERLGDAPRDAIGPAALASQVAADLGLLALISGPLVLAAALVGVVGSVAQSGWVFAPERLALDFSRLAPAHGLKRLAPSQSAINVLKTLVVAAAVGGMSYLVIQHVLVDVARLSWMTARSVAAEGWGRITGLLWQTGFVLLAFAGLDYGLQRWRHYTSLKMTRQEVKDEARSNEGSPEIKGRVRRVQREMSRRRMLSAVPTATVVITNPTHYAVAIRYDRASAAAPIVVAKGRDHLALKIRAVAREAGVPIVENVALAQALHKGAEVGDQIPGALFGAVAEVLAYLVRIKQLML